MAQELFGTNELNYSFSITSNYIIMESSNLILNKIGSSSLEEKKLSIAESVTSGLLQPAFSQIPQAEQFYKGGLTAYNLEQKVNLLNIDYD